MQSLAPQSPGTSDPRQSLNGPLDRLAGLVAKVADDSLQPDQHVDAAEAAAEAATEAVSAFDQTVRDLGSGQDSW